MVQNIYSLATGLCAFDAVTIRYCGDRLTSNSEQCDDGNTINGDGCSSVCTFETNYCSGVTLYVHPIVAYSGTTTVTYTGTFSGSHTSGYRFLTLNYGFGGYQTINGST